MSYSKQSCGEVTQSLVRVFPFPFAYHSTALPHYLPSLHSTSLPKRVNKLLPRSLFRSRPGDTQALLSSRNSISWNPMVFAAADTHSPSSQNNSATASKRRTVVAPAQMEGSAITVTVTVTATGFGYGYGYTTAPSGIMFVHYNTRLCCCS